MAFTGCFYQGCWTIIKSEVIAIVQDFFQGSALPRGIASTSLVLISKVDNPTGLGDLRPISFCNFSGKVF